MYVMLDSMNGAQSFLIVIVSQFSVLVPLDYILYLYTAHLAYLVHKSGRKTSIIIFIYTKPLSSLDTVNPGIISTIKK